jgi:hypothetical protein
MTTREEMDEMIYPRQYAPRLRIENSSRTILVLTTFLIIANGLLIGHSLYTSFFEQPCNIYPFGNFNNTANFNTVTPITPVRPSANDTQIDALES